jgi:hypothetical protein
MHVSAPHPHTRDRLLHAEHQHGDQGLQIEISTLRRSIFHLRNGADALVSSSDLSHRARTSTTKFSQSLANATWCGNQSGGLTMGRLHLQVDILWR